MAMDDSEIPVPPRWAQYLVLGFMSANVLATLSFLGFAGILLKRRRTFLTIGFFILFVLELATWPPAIYKLVEYLHTNRIDRWWGLYLL